MKRGTVRKDMGMEWMWRSLKLIFLKVGSPNFRKTGR